MWSFAGGLILGCLFGVTGCLLFLWFLNAVPDGSAPSARRFLPGWQLTAAIMLLMLTSTLICQFLGARRSSFVALIFLLLVFIAAKARGRVASLATLVFGSILLSYILPPSNSWHIADTTDRAFLVVFICFGLIGSRLVGRPREIV